MKNQFEPEDFEKESEEIIRLLKKIPREEVSEDFDQKFFAARDKVKLSKPMRLQIKEAFKGLFSIHIYKLSFAAGLGAAILLFFILNSRNTEHEPPVQLSADTVKITGNKNPPVASSQHQEQYDETIDKSRIKKEQREAVDQLFRELNSSADKYSTSDKINHDSIIKIMDTKQFKVKMDSVGQRGTYKDTLKVILDILE